ncbi:MAG: cytochrome d ubiquinol oxidase subunit II, partial [Gammaproteobacteria bacterium]|nr:cytochrome d ubiquinol oxidase subunit II [Gammaproteobacteria bacterium]
MLINFSNILPLPTIFGILIGFAILMYILLDGFVLGVGILFPFAPSNKCRESLMHSIAPFWDANQTWLVLGGGGLLISFPLAYSILLAAYYVPIICMLIGLVFRGACFEFYMKESEPSIKMLWSYGFHFGSLCAAFFQGCILGSYIQGVTVIGRNFAGQSWDWFSGLSMMMGILLVFGYALIGASWGIIKTSEET